MLKKDTPFYKISFLDTYQVNKLVPMKVEPAPKSIYRLFMDWVPLENEPTEHLKPQSLDKIERNGFVLVEWGGLKR